MKRTNQLTELLERITATSALSSVNVRSDMSVKEIVEYLTEPGKNTDISTRLKRLQTLKVVEVEKLDKGNYAVRYKEDTIGFTYLRRFYEDFVRKEVMIFMPIV